MRGAGPAPGPARRTRAGDPGLPVRGGGGQPGPSKPGGSAQHQVPVRAVGRGDRDRSGPHARLRPGRDRHRRRDGDRGAPAAGRVQRVSEYEQPVTRPEDRPRRAPFERRPALRQRGRVHGRGAGPGLDDQFPPLADGAGDRVRPARSGTLWRGYPSFRNSRVGAIPGDGQRRPLLYADGWV